MTGAGSSAAAAEEARARTLVLSALALFAFTFALNSNALGAFFVGDDFDFLLGMRDLDSLAETVSFRFWGEWEPLWWASWYADYRIWGAWPPGFHLTNVFWASICVVCLFGFVRTAWPRYPVAAWAAALLFASHPIHDEAVTYLAARGHPMATGLALAALWAFAGLRARGVVSRAGRCGVWALALGSALLAALAKETALVLPAWVAAVALAMDRGDGALGRLRRAGRDALIFALPGLATLALRALFVGVESDKLTGGLSDPLSVIAESIVQLPLYAMLGGGPLPLAFLDETTLVAWRWIGWLLVLVVGAGWPVAWFRALRRDERASAALQLWGVGLLVFVSSLGPVLWADLALRRRYLFTPSVGIGLIAGALFLHVHSRRPRAAWTALVLLVGLGSAGTWQRNDLYVRSGALALGVIESLRGAPLAEPAPDRPRDAALLTMPRAYGGDMLSGAYLLHHTDLHSALGFYDAAHRRIHYALTCEYAEDYRAEVRLTGRHELVLDVTFRHPRAYASAAALVAEEEQFGDLLYATLLAADADARRLSYRVFLRPGFWDQSALYLFSDGVLAEIAPPPAPVIDLSIFDEP